LLRAYKREVLRSMRIEGGRVRTSVRREVPKRTGNLRKKIKLKTGWDSRGPYARIFTSARRITRDAETKAVTSMFRYGLARQQKDHYLQRGLARTPRR
jgi:hypothetical protein